MESTGWQPHSIRGFLSGTIRKKMGQELLELGFRHAIAFDSEAVFRVSLVCDVIGRVGEYEIRRFAAHQFLYEELVRRVAYQQLVIAQDPKIPVC